MAKAKASAAMHESKGMRKYITKAGYVKRSVPKSLAKKFKVKWFESGKKKAAKKKTGAKTKGTRKVVVGKKILKRKKPAA